MSLANLIRKRPTGNIATAISAIPATRRVEDGATVARIATIAVANPTKPEADPAITSWGWLLHYPASDPVTVFCLPEPTHQQVLEMYPDAIAAEPFAPIIRQPTAPMTGKEETTIRAWLALIEETDPATIADVMNKCQQEADARDYFTGQAAAELPKPDSFNDDRRTCSQCRNHLFRACAIAKPEHGALVVAMGGYRPDPVIPRRCAGYAPSQHDSDQRSGAERWPGLLPRNDKGE